MRSPVRRKTSSACPWVVGILAFLSILGICSADVTVRDIQYTTEPGGDSPLVGQTVETVGMVTSGSGEWQGTLNGGFFLADSTGPWHGIYVWAPGHNVIRSDSVRVTGIVAEYFGKTEIQATSIDILSTRSRIPAPSPVTPAQVPQESMEGVLVFMENVVVVDPDLGYGEWRVGDGVGSCRVDDDAEYGYQPSMDDTLLLLRGIVDYAFGEFKVEPRGDGDIVESGIPGVQAFFGRSGSPFDATDVRLDTLMAHWIARAVFSIDLCIYSVSSWDVVNALTLAFDRGVRVRVIVEHDNRTSTYVSAIENAGIPVIDDACGINPGTYNMHNKFMVLDVRDSTTRCDDFSWTGSYNASYSSALYNADNVLLVRNSPISFAYTLEFEEMWGGPDDAPDPDGSRFGTRKSNNTPHLFDVEGDEVRLYFSPSGGAGAQMTNEITQADNSIRFCIYHYTHDLIESAMESRWDAGVFVQGVFDSTFWLDPAHQSKSWEMSGLGGSDPWNPPADVYPDSIGSGGILHHKYMIVDGDVPNLDPTVITGSMNWSFSGDSRNDENTLIIKAPDIAIEYLMEYRARLEEAGGTYEPGFVTIYDIQHTVGTGDSSGYCGRTVVTSGVVTGVYGDTCCFVEERPGGPWRGIFVASDGSMDPLPARGDSLELRARVDELDGQTILDVSSGEIVVRASGRPLPDPEVPPLSDMILEQYEGVLVRAEEVTVLTEPDTTGEFLVTDGLGVVAVDDMGYAHPAEPGECLTLSGCVYRAGDDTWIEPRDRADVNPPGDANGDGLVTVSDAAFLSVYLGFGGPEPDPLALGDVDGDSEVDSNDLRYLLTYLIFRGPSPLGCQ
jgi:phosphatidylserine/phosphatidylglycerophosphate/cardiolipin synthase-like enzyme